MSNAPVIKHTLSDIFKVIAAISLIALAYYVMSNIDAMVFTNGGR